MQNTEDSHDSDSIVFAIAFAIACDFSATALGEDWKKLQIMIMEQTFKLIECLSPEELLHWMEKKTAATSRTTDRCPKHSSPFIFLKRRTTDTTRFAVKRRNACSTKIKPFLKP
jgi:hypothetical protein